MFLLVGAAFALVAYVRHHLAGIALERDEGEYAYAGQLIRHGIPPYQLAYNMKFPGTYYAYAAVMSVFGETAMGIRAGLMSVHVASAALLFLIARRMTGTLAAGVATAAFLILGLDRWAMGPFAHATHFVVLPSLAAWLVLDIGLRSGRGWMLVCAGVFAGLAVAMKQQAIPLAVLAIVLAAWPRKGSVRGLPAWRRAALVTAGIAITLGLMVAVLAASGVLGKFWFWTFQYAVAYVSEVPVAMATAVFQMAWGYITNATAWIWYAGVVGVLLLLVVRWQWETRRFLVFWLIASAAAVATGFYFRPHYFILLMPVAAMFVGVAIASVDRIMSRSLSGTTSRAIALVLAAGLAGTYVIIERHYLFEMKETELIRSLYEDNPFLEAPEIGKYIAAHTDPGDRIAVLGSEPQIYFYANRQSATGYIYTYPLMEKQPYAPRMNAEFRDEIIAAKPKYLVFSGIHSSWGIRAGSDTSVMTWAGEYATKCYELAGVTEVDKKKGADIRWDAETIGYKPTSEAQVMIYRRKPGTCGK